MQLTRLSFLIITILYYGTFHVTAKNNVCNNVIGYYLLFLPFPGCYYDPDVNADVPDIIKNNGYPLKTHYVLTEDGYILTLFNIPYVSSKCQSENDDDMKGRSVLLVHSDFATSASYVLSKNDSLAFVLADLCYNVWLANIRGSRFSQAHATLTVNDNEYWNYSIDEMALYDMPAILDLIEKNTGKKGTICVGFALGASMIMAYSASEPEESKQRIDLAVLLSEAIQIRKTKVPILKVIGTYGAQLWEDVYEKNLAEQVSSYHYQRAIANLLEFLLGVPLFFELAVQTFGPNTEIKIDRAPALLNSELSGLSLKAFVHMCQFSVGDFAAYDYGAEKNLEVYNDTRPPIYNITDIEHPVLIVHATDDFFATKQDVDSVYEMLSSLAKRLGTQEINKKGFNHFGYAYANNAKEL